MNARGPARRLWARLPEIGWLALVWVLLWGTFSPLTALGGLLVGALVTGLFRLPLAPARLPLRPVRLAILLAYLVYDLVLGTVEVSWQTLRYGPRACGAILAVPLFGASDRVVTLMAHAVSLSPGTGVLQIDHRHDVWYVYALGPRDILGVERARRRALVMQRRVVAAVGSADELARVRGHLADRGVGS